MQTAEARCAPFAARAHSRMRARGCPVTTCVRPRMCVWQPRGNFLVSGLAGQAVGGQAPRVDHLGDPRLTAAADS